MLKNKILVSFGCLLCLVGGSTYGYFRGGEWKTVSLAPKPLLNIPPQSVGIGKEDSEKVLSALRVVQVNATENAKAWRKMNPAKIQGVDMYVVMRDHTLNDTCPWGSGWGNVMVGVDTRMGVKTYEDLMCPTHKKGACVPIASFTNSKLGCAGAKKVARLD